MYWDERREIHLPPQITISTTTLHTNSLVILDAFPFTFSICSKETSFIMFAKFLQKKDAN